MRRNIIRASSIVEYSLLMIVLVAAVLGIQIYLKRAICGRWRQSVDTFGYGRQYVSPNIKIWGK